MTLLAVALILSHQATNPSFLKKHRQATKRRTQKVRPIHGLRNELQRERKSASQTRSMQVLGDTLQCGVSLQAFPQDQSGKWYLLLVVSIRKRQIAIYTLYLPDVVSCKGEWHGS
jgi:hypothetical protein